MNPETENRPSPPQPTAEVLDKLVSRHMVAAFSVGLIPIPVMDLAAMTGVQLNLVRKLCIVYQVPFSKNIVKSIIAALVGGAVPLYSGAVLASLTKSIPVLGTPLGVVTVPAVSTASTYAVGHIFIEHFESGGTLLDFNANTAKERFLKLFSKAKRDAAVERKHHRGPVEWGGSDDSEGSEETPAEPSSEPIVDQKPKKGPV